MIQKTIKNDFDYFGIFKNSRISKNPKIWKIDLAQCHVKRDENSFDVPKFISSAFFNEILIFQKFEKISSFGHFIDVLSLFWVVSLTLWTF